MSMRLGRWLWVACSLVVLGCARRPPGGDMGSSTVVYVAERIRTLDSAHPTAQALAVRDGKVLVVGTRDEVRKIAGGDARLVELAGATIVPGLVDAHGHTLSLGKSLSTIDLRGAPSLAAAIERVKAPPAGAQQGDWLVGRGWDQNDWSDTGGKFPDKRALDAVHPGRAIYLARIDGHAAWVSSEALRRAGIDAKTPDPEGGRIIRDAAGEPTGVLVDNAMNLVEAKLPDPSDDQRALWLRNAVTHLASVGLTEVHDAGMDLATFTLLQQWDALGMLPIRVYAMADGQSAEGATYLERGPFQGRMLTMRSVKLYADGALGSRGAALHGPYADEPTHDGLLLLSPEELERRARAFMGRGFQVNVHAIGDRANTLTIETLARLAQETKTTHLRHRLEHLQILRLDDLPKMKAAGLMASMQPVHATSDMPWAEKRIGKERLPGAYAWRSVLDAGVPLVFGSDFPIELPDPLHGLYAARTRQDANGQPPNGWLPEQKLTPEEALQAFTLGAATAAHAEERRGKLAPGMDADFTALSVDPIDAAPLAVRNARAIATVVSGVEVYRQ